MQNYKGKGFSKNLAGALFAGLLGAASLLPGRTYANDLRVSDVYEGQAPDGRPIAFFKLHNDGSETVTGLEYKAGSESYKINSTLRPNSTAGVYAFLGSGDRTIVLDPVNAIPESDETNNFGKAMIDSTAGQTILCQTGCSVHMRDQNNCTSGPRWQWVVGSTEYEFDGAVNYVSTENGNQTFTKPPLEGIVPATAAMNHISDISVADKNLWTSVGNFYTFIPSATTDTHPFATQTKSYWDTYIETSGCAITSVPEPPVPRDEQKSWGAVKSLFR